MVARELLLELNQRGITLTVLGDQLHAEFPAGSMTPELSQRIGALKGELLSELRRQATSTCCNLPPPLHRIVRAAVANQLSRPGFLPSGMVSDLGQFVLACAALHAIGVEPQRQVRDLEAAQSGWAQ
ncbi:TubC N-terminal docking domain-related protein [Deinococcus radiotolerans]|uniref:TubC N-terminal docking domain-containing protein n=1 Tax=Deinococcus radiotolerans TaxID=1309407 RepID=A0ABQ2FIK1_9DEIO|nr:hypothetical protein [Deinococcus radiotolerans]GGK95481.1 hypothetical protein GCM10010844_12460 [Deinococcus radiotolerans]